jgi:hypothetical protein
MTIRQLGCACAQDSRSEICRLSHHGGQRPSNKPEPERFRRGVSRVFIHVPALLNTNIAHDARTVPSESRNTTRLQRAL